MMRRAYQSDLSDEEWDVIEPHLPAPKATGRSRLRPLREILDAVFYVLRSGGACVMVPKKTENALRFSARLADGTPEVRLELAGRH